MNGMHRATGKPLDGTAHLAQSVADILTTPIGSRVMRRDYGSLLPELVDAPANPSTRLALFAATAVALSRWEPRIRIRKVAFERGGSPGEFTLQLDGTRTDLPPAGGLASLTIPLNFSAAAGAPAFA